MRTRTTVTTAIAGAAGLTLVLGMPLPASAHVELDASSVSPATLSILTFAVAHGCDGSPTTSLAIDFPADVQAVTPTVKPGWSITEIDTGSGSTVTYTASTPLDSGYRDTVQISALLPVSGQDGDVVTFPVLQTCEVGSTAWDDVSTGGTEPDSPAPALTLGASTGADTGASTSTVSTDDAAAIGAPVDAFARVLGLGAALVGVIAVVLVTVALRRQQGSTR